MSGSSVGDLPPKSGRIITFYSYKGGTGRSMTLANLAWILASNGKSVLAIDWDLEAPGLHRYFRPFLSDGELADTPGLIDFFVHFVEAAGLQARQSSGASSVERPWYQDSADLFRYAVPLDYEFPAGGVLDLVGAGQQGPSYSDRVNSFAWNDFYGKLGGGTFLEAMKVQLREKYDYVLVDSRTGLSDTSGICTVQMPDDLVVCFTLNRQSRVGAAAVASSADAQRRLPTGEPGLRIWPVPTRVELHEKERLDAARASARSAFAGFLWHVPVAQRGSYWDAVEQLYFPYYAYEEVLATIADSAGQRSSLLGSYDRLASRLTSSPKLAMPSLPAAQRKRLLERYQTAVSPGRSSGGRFFLSFATADAGHSIVARIAQAIDERFGSRAASWLQTVPLGNQIRTSLDRAVDDAEALLLVVGPRWQESKGSRHELNLALESQKRIIPVMIKNASFEVLPPELKSLRAARLRRSSFATDLDLLIDELEAAFPSGKDSTVDPDDPHKGQFGGRSSRNGRTLGAKVTSRGNGWFGLELTVAATNREALTGEVEFHLHPSFHPSEYRVTVHDGRAVLSDLRAWGAFTVGAVADGGSTRLELDLAALPGAPKLFRER